MAVLPENPTMADIQKTLDPDGKPARIIKMLRQTNRMLDDMVWIECNSLNHHQTTVDVALPEVFFRQYNQGVPASEGSEAQFLEKTALMEAWGVVDKELADAHPDVGAYRLMRSKKKIEAMNQRAQRTVIYGSSSEETEFPGLHTRFSDPTAANGEQIIDGGGTGSDNTSYYLICWGEDKAHGIYPQHKVAGLQHNDFGASPVQTSTTLGAGQMVAYRDQYIWRLGISTPDWRYLSRGANIDTVLLGGGSEVSLIQMMIDSISRLPDDYDSGKCAFYMNRTLIAHLENQMRTEVKDGGGLTYENVDGKRVMFFRGIPIRKVDAFVNNESTVVFA